MTDLTYFLINGGRIDNAGLQAVFNARNQVPTARRGATSLPFAYHRHHDNGVRHTAIFTPDETTLDAETGIYSGGTFTNTWEVYQNGIRGFLPNSILPQNLPIGTYTDSDMPFTPPRELLIASSANHFHNFVEVLKSHLGASVGLGRKTMAWWQERLRSAEEKITASHPQGRYVLDDEGEVVVDDEDNPTETESVANDRQKQPLYDDYMAQNPTSTMTLEQFTHDEALGHAKAICDSVAHLHPRFLIVWSEGIKRAGLIRNAGSPEVAAQEFQKGVVWMFAHYPEAADVEVLRITGQQVQLYKDADFSVFLEVVVGSEHLIQIKCALDPNSPMGETLEDGNAWGIKHIDGSMIDGSPVVEGGKK